MTHVANSNNRRRLTPFRLILAVVAVLIIGFSWWGLVNSRHGLINRTMTGEGNVPLRFIAPVELESLPGVVIAHGFAGSQQLMFGYATTLARSGYGVMLLDFDGHGSNGGRLDPEGGSLQRNLDVAYQALLAQPEIDSARIALLGHSMGSGVVMRAGIEQAERYRATVAVSPTGADVTAERPRNLLLQAGSLEPQFADNARELLAAAGGQNDDLAGGRGRRLVIIPNVEHISILFSRASQQAALDWLNATFEIPTTVAGPDRRVLWYAAHLGGWLLLLTAVSPWIPARTSAPAPRRRPPWHWLGLVGGAAGAVATITLLGRLMDISGLGGLLVGGVLGLWFLVLGLVWLISGFQWVRPTGNDILLGVALFIVLTLAFGIMAQLVWLPWWLNAPRLVRWPFMAAASLPFYLAAGMVQFRTPVGRRIGWWLLQTIVIVAGLGLTVVLNPGLFFVVLLMPVIPIVLGIMAIAGAAFERPWAYGIGNALFFGWLLVAVFPLA